MVSDILFGFRHLILKDPIRRRRKAEVRTAKRTGDKEARPGKVWTDRRLR